MRGIVLLTFAALGFAAGSGAQAQTFLVFFASSSIELDDPAMGVVEAVADRAKADPKARVMVLGYADPAGTPQANAAISRARAQVVYDRLVQEGLPRERVMRAARGPIDFTVSPQESRRVEVRLDSNPQPWSSLPRFRWDQQKCCVSAPPFERPQPDKSPGRARLKAPQPMWLKPVRGRTV